MSLTPSHRLELIEELLEHARRQKTPDIERWLEMEKAETEKEVEQLAAVSSGYFG